MILYNCPAQPNHCLRAVVVVGCPSCRVLFLESFKRGCINIPPTLLRMPGTLRECAPPLQDAKGERTRHQPQTCTRLTVRSVVEHNQKTERRKKTNRHTHTLTRTDETAWIETSISHRQPRMSAINRQPIKCCPPGAAPKTIRIECAYRIAPVDR